MLGTVHTRPFQAPSTFSPKESPFGVASQSGDPRPSTGAQGAGGSPDPPRPKGEHRPRDETGKRCFAEQTRSGAVLAIPRRVSLWRRQLPEARFVPFLRWALGVSLPSWRNMGCWGQCTQGLFWPHPPSPQRSAHLELVSSGGDRQPSSSAHGARGSPAPPWA